MKANIRLCLLFLTAITGVGAGSLPARVYEERVIRRTVSFEIGQVYAEQFTETAPLSSLVINDGYFTTYNGKLADQFAVPFEILLPAIVFPPGAEVEGPSEMFLFLEDYSRISTRYEWRPIQQSCGGFPCSARAAVFTYLVDNYGFSLFERSYGFPLPYDPYYTLGVPGDLPRNYVLSGKELLLSGSLRHVVDGDSDVSFSRDGYNSFTKAVYEGEIRGTIVAAVLYSYSYQPTAVPEPSTIGLAAAFLGALVCFRFRRFATAATY